MGLFLALEIKIKSIKSNLSGRGGLCCEGSIVGLNKCTCDVHICFVVLTLSTTSGFSIVNDLVVKDSVHTRLGVNRVPFVRNG